MNRHVRSLLIPALSLLITSCLGGNSDEPAATDSQTGNLPPPIYGTNPSPIDTESNVLGPWFFKSTNFELTRTTTDFTIGSLQPGRYKLKIQNGNYGPFLARTCAAQADSSLRRQCLYDNLIEKTTQEFTRTEKSKGTLNGNPLFSGKTLTRTFAYKEESIQLQATNQFLMDVQAFPTASLKLAIDYAEEFATPVALFSVNSLSGTAPATIKFNAVHSYDADNADTLTYEWNFGDGQTATGMSTSHVFSAAGTYVARLKVTDQTGRFDEFSAEIFVKAPGTAPPATNKNPVLKLAITYPDPENLRKINVSLAQSYDTDGLVTAYSIDFSDGTKLTASEAEHTYAKDGTYLLKVSVTDDLGGKASLTESLSISTTNDLIAAAKIYGTKTYYGDIIGERRISDSFNITDTNAIYKLTIKNADGLPHDQKSCSGISGASLLSCQYDNLVNKTYIATQRLDYVHAYLNGKQITDSSAINKSNYIFSTIISPLEINSLEIRMKGYPTAYAQIYIEKMQVADNTPPILSLRSPRPEENYYSNQSPTNIQVVVDSNKVLTAGSINGVTARVLNGNILVADIPFAASGRNQINVQATDLEGNTGSANFGFDLIRDQEAPQIQINYADNSTTNKTVIDLPITILDSSPTTTSISLNGQELFITGAKNFTTPITLPFEGENIITVQSADEAGNASGVYSLRINRDTTPPMLVLSHVSGAVIKEIMFNYSGTANEPMAYVKMNGYSLNLNSAQNGFSDQFVGENLGYYNLNFEYADLYGNVGTSAIQVRLIGKLINQALVTLNPDPDGEHIWVIGNHSAARPNARVNAYQGLFNMNRGTATAQSNGAFAIKLKLAPAVTVSVFDSEFNEEEQFDLYANLNTTITGVIKDIYDIPLVNAKVSVDGMSTSVYTDGNGVFSIQNPPTGDRYLIIDGSEILDSTEGPVRGFSPLTRVAVNISLGKNNTMGLPIYLSPLFYDDSETDINEGSAATVTSPHAPGVQIEVPADTAVFPDGTDTGSINVISVPSDKVVTPVPQNFVPTKVTSLEPSGLKFDGRVALTLPNDNELPPETDMVIFSMDSATGKWVIDGLAKVSADGQSVKTKDNAGISHFSSVYAAPLAPVMTFVQNPNFVGIDISKGSLSNSVQMPSFKILGQEVAPSLHYKSSWAHPTALISNFFDIPERKVYATQTDEQTVTRSGDLAWEQCWNWGLLGSGCVRIPYGFYWMQTQIHTVSEMTNMYKPDSIKSQFFISHVASDQVSINDESAPHTEHINQIDVNSGNQISNAEATGIIEQLGIPNRAVMSYGVELIDTRTGNYFDSGIYPALARFQIKLKNLTITTQTQNMRTDGLTVILGIPWPTIDQRTRRVDTRISSSIFDLLPQDLTTNLLVQNKVNSNAGRGWHIGGAQRIMNPTNSKIMIEEASGDISTYALNNAITTLFDGTNKDVDLENGVDLSAWPKAIAARQTQAGSYFGEIDLSQGNPTVQNIGVLPSSSGQVVDQSYTSCAKEYRCQYVWCWDHYVGQFDTKSYQYTAKAQVGGILRSAGGEIYTTNNFEHTFYRYNGSATRISGSVSAVDEYIYGKNQTGEYFLSTNNDYNSECQKYFGKDCTGAQTAATGQNCEAANSIIHAAWECTGHGTFNECNGWAWRYYGATPGQKMYTQSSGQIGVAGSGESGLNNPTYIAGSTDGKIYFSDTGNNRVRMYDPTTGTVTTVAGNETTDETGENVPATQVGVFHPKGLAFDTQGNLYIATENGPIRKVDTNGMISTYAGKLLSSGGVVSDEAPAKDIFISSPEGLLFDSERQFLYVSDGAGNKVFRIDLLTEIASNVAGNGNCVQGDIGDGGPAAFSTICKPTHLGLDDQRNLIVVDSGHKKIRRVMFAAPTSGSLAFAPSNKDLSRLIKNQNGTWTRQYRNGNYDYFSPEGYQTQSADRVGRTTNFQYDGNHNLIGVTFPNGQTLQYNYAMNKLQSIVDPAGRMTSFMYTGEFLNQVNFPDGTNRKFFYDTNGKMISEKDQRGNTTEYTYSAWNKLYQVKKPDGTIVTVFDVANQTVMNDYTSGNVGTPKSPGTDADQVSGGITDAKSNTTKLSENHQGFISEIVDSQNNVTLIDRDIQGKPIEVKKGKYSVPQTPEEPKVFQNIVAHSKMTYDPVTSDLLKSKDEILGLEETKLYDQYGNVISETNAKNQTVQKAYDPLNGLLMQVTYPNGAAEAYGYNQKGQVTQKIVQNNSSNILTTYEYDTNGRMTKVTDNGGKFTRFVYDNAGNQIQSISTTNGTDQLVTSYEYDAFNRLTKVTSPKNEVTMYEYLATGELQKITDPNSNITTFEYDSMGRLQKKTDPLGNIHQFAYDGNGNRTQEIDPNGNQKSYQYDSLNRMIVANFPDDSVQYQYNEKGEVIFAANSVSQMNVEKDSKDRVTLATLTGLNAMSDYPTIDLAYGYDAADNRIHMSANNGGYGEIYYAYDDNNRLTNITNTWGGGFDYQFDQAGRLITLNRPGGNSSFTYTDSGALAKIEHVGNNQVQNYFEYFYDQRNFPTTKRTPAGDYNYSYDNNGQLTNATNPSQPAEAFSYDALGNRTQDEARAYGYDSKGQRLLDDGVYLYQYDGNGNVTSQLPKNINSTADAYRFTYSSKNQLIKAEVFAGSLGAKIREINYVYDVLGRRMQKAVQDFVETSSILKNFTRKYGYDGQNIFVEFDANNNLLARHTHNPLTLDDILSTNYTVHAVNAQIAQYQGNFYYLKDHLGSIMDITDSAGTVVQKYNYKSFGSLISVRSGNGDDISAAPVVRGSFTYTGREWESEVDMFYYRARWYSPTTGRFLQSDPDPGSLQIPLSSNNKYIYGFNNSIIFKDAKGKSPLGDFFVALVSFFVGYFLGPIIAAGNAVGSAIAGAVVGAIAGGITNVAIGNGTFDQGVRIGAVAGFLGGALGWYNSLDGQLSRMANSTPSRDSLQASTNGRQVWSSIDPGGGAYADDILRSQTGALTNVSILDLFKPIAAWGIRRSACAVVTLPMIIITEGGAAPLGALCMITTGSSTAH